MRTRQTYTISIAIDYTEVMRTHTSTAAEARAQARIYMNMLCPLPAWAADNFQSSEGGLTGAVVRDRYGCQLLGLLVYPQLPRDLI